jgi:hypothetical protein
LALARTRLILALEHTGLNLGVSDVENLGNTRIMPKVLRWEIPIDDEDHPVTFAGNVSYVAITSLIPGIGTGKLEFWTFDDTSYTNDPDVPRARLFRVFGTGQEVPKGYFLIGTAPRVSGLVFHLFEKTMKK